MKGTSRVVECYKEIIPEDKLNPWVVILENGREMRVNRRISVGEVFVFFYPLNRP